ncbi:hypothetical protein FGO68_gene8078 [Halteria grandinella]|uniref:Uncharacterized protein n=1 Tax=Halteria grandinella TaxID=5974 RepID=A0A8J8NF26_HALGN|nr:hypothetical protein FGO68_gene8078 [Halteria grandinella]
MGVLVVGGGYWAIDYLLKVVVCCYGYSMLDTVIALHSHWHEPLSPAGYRHIIFPHATIKRSTFHIWLFIPFCHCILRIIIVFFIISQLACDFFKPLYSTVKCLVWILPCRK